MIYGGHSAATSTSRHDHLLSGHPVPLDDEPLTIGKFIIGNQQSICLIRSRSDEALVVEFLSPPDASAGNAAQIEFCGTPKLSVVVTAVHGLVFDLSVRESLGSDPAAGQTMRRLRFNIAAPARLRIGVILSQIETIDLSQQGAKLNMASTKPEICIEWPTMIGQPSLLNVRGLAHPRLGTLCWVKGEKAGFKFYDLASVPELDAILRAVPRKD